MLNKVVLNRRGDDLMAINGSADQRSSFILIGGRRPPAVDDLVGKNGTSL